MLSGERLYDDIWADVKPPAVYVTFAAVQAFAGDGFLHVYLLSVIAAIVTMLGVYHAASIAGPLAGTFAATFWAAMCFDPGMGGNLPNTEVFINARVAWAFATVAPRLACRGEPARPRAGRTRDSHGSDGLGSGCCSSSRRRTSRSRSSRRSSSRSSNSSRRAAGDSRTRDAGTYRRDGRRRRDRLDAALRLLRR